MLLFAQYKTMRGLPLSAVSLSRCITCQDVSVQQSHAGKGATKLDGARGKKQVWRPRVRT